MFLDYFDVLILKINLKNKKKYYFDVQIQNTLKNKRYHNVKHNLRTYLAQQQLLFFKVIFKLFFI